MIMRAVFNFLSEGMHPRAHVKEGYRVGQVPQGILTPAFYPTLVAPDVHNHVALRTVSPVFRKI